MANQFPGETPPLPPSMPPGPPVPPQGPPLPMRPHHGTLILVLGIVSVVCDFVCCIGWPFALAGGIVAWIMGNNDLREMQAGYTDPSGRAMANAGRICGIIGLALLVLVISFVMIYGIASGELEKAIRDGMKS